MKKVKMFFSALAVVFAIAGALATSAFDNAPLTAIQVTRQTSAPCDPDGFCSNTGTAACHINNDEDLAIYKKRLPSGQSFTCQLDAVGEWSATN